MPAPSIVIFCVHCRKETKARKLSRETVLEKTGIDPKEREAVARSRSSSRWNFCGGCRHVYSAPPDR